MSTNQQIKQLVATGQLCYICKRRTPLPGVDEVGSHSCQSCRGNITVMRRRYVLQDGYAECLPCNTRGRARV